jgi:hypothetical protein
MVVAPGRRYKRRRASARLAGAVASVTAVLLLSSCTGHSGAGNNDTPAGAGTGAALQNLQLIQQFPPSGNVANLGTVPSGAYEGWSELAWMSSNELCFGTADLRAGTMADLSGGTMGELNCAPASEELSAPGRPPAVYIPAFTPAGGPGAALTFGFARGPVTTVTIEMFGKTTTTVTPVSSTPIGAHAVLIPVTGHSSWGSSDITAIIGRDRSGKVIAHSS